MNGSAATLLRALARYVRPPRTTPGGGERCELCGTALGADHPHVVEIERRALLCACRACALLFAGGGSLPAGRYRTVPDEVLAGPELLPTREEWTALGVPVGLFFVVRSSHTGRWTVVFPSPAGPTESELPDDAWERLLASRPALGRIEPDVQALLVRHRRGGELEALIVPISACYELVASIRTRWRGLDGGDEAWQAADALLARLSARARKLPGGTTP